MIRNSNEDLPLLWQITWTLWGRKVNPHVQSVDAKHYMPLLGVYIIIILKNKPQEEEHRARLQ